MLRTKCYVSACSGFMLLFWFGPTLSHCIFLCRSINREPPATYLPAALFDVCFPYNYSAPISAEDAEASAICATATSRGRCVTRLLHPLTSVLQHPLAFVIIRTACLHLSCCHLFSVQILASLGTLSKLPVAHLLNQRQTSCAAFSVDSTRLRYLYSPLTSSTPHLALSVFRTQTWEAANARPYPTSDTSDLNHCLKSPNSPKW